MGRIHQSITYKFANRPESPPELRAWLVFLWCESWAQIPIATLPDDDASIAAIIGMPVSYFALHKSILMRGWKRYSDGRLYHDYLTSLVLATLRERARYKRHREKEDGEETHLQPTDNKKRNVAATLPLRAEGKVKVESKSKSNTKPKTIVATALPNIPDWIPAEPWAEFVRMRRSIRKPLSPYATRLAFGKLQSMRTEGHNIQAVLEQSTFNCWQGLFPPKDVASAGATGWWTSESGTLAKQAELGLSSRSNESWTQLRARIATAIKGKT